jgi:molybdate transport system regulatory protein
MNHLHPNSKIWIYSDTNEGVFGDGKARLLTAIRDHGSLSEAARVLNISYRKAWADLKKSEQCLGCSLVIRLRGGKQGGKMELTETGLALLERYTLFRAKVSQAIELLFEEAFQR